MNPAISTPPTPDIQRVLFLDFDGVLHPLHEARLNPFGYMENFSGVLREVDRHATMPIVISSTWRLLQTLEELRAHFPPDIATRIVDVTPFLSSANPDLRGSREREISAWMAEHAPDGAWIALDDTELYFEVDCPHLFLIDEDFAQFPSPAQAEFSLVAEIEERERLTALWQSRGLGVNLRVAEKLRHTLQKFVKCPPVHRNIAR